MVLIRIVGLPVFGGAEVGDVGYVMDGVPGVVHGGDVQLHGAALRMFVTALELRRRHGLQEHDPTGVDAFEQIDGPLDGSGGVVQFGEGLFVVAGDDGPVFGEGFAEAVEGGHVRVRDVMDDLADGPTAVAVGRVELVVFEVEHRRAKLRWHLTNCFDGVTKIFRRYGFPWGEVADGITRIVGLRHGALGRKVENW